MIGPKERELLKKLGRTDEELLEIERRREAVVAEIGPLLVDPRFDSPDDAVFAEALPPIIEIVRDPEKSRGIVYSAAWKAFVGRHGERVMRLAPGIHAARREAE